MSILTRLFQRPNPGRELALQGHQQYRDRVHARCNEMLVAMGKDPIDWSRLR